MKSSYLISTNYITETKYDQNDAENAHDHQIRLVSSKDQLDIRYLFNVLGQILFIYQWEEKDDLSMTYCVTDRFWVIKFDMHRSDVFLFVRYNYGERFISFVSFFFSIKMQKQKNSFHRYFPHFLNRRTTKYRSLITEMTKERTCNEHQVANQLDMNANHFDLE